MRKWRLAASAALALASGCAANIEAAAARHQARAAAFDAAGYDEGALREREAADAERDKLPSGDAASLAPLTVF
jgi:hypothetical protein